MQEIENLKEEKLTISSARANVFGFLMPLPIALFFGLLYYMIWKPKINIKDLMDNLTPLLIFCIFILGLVIHELIHGITWAGFAKNGFKSIKFGILWKMLAPYCHCKEPLKVKHYVIGAFTPAIILGFIPSIFAIAVGNIELIVFGFVFTMAAGGDFLIINMLRKENSEDLVQDHPSEAGCFIYRKNE